MKTKLLCMLIITTTSTTHHMHAMKELTIFSPKPTYGSLSTYEQQLKLPDDIIYKIIAYCSNTARSKLRETCKQLSFLASVNRLDNLLMHDFTIGNEEERQTFFNTLIKTNNPNVITTIYHYAQKEAESYNFIQSDAVHITLEPTDFTKQEYIQKSYLNPLLQVALQQDSETMVDALTTKGADYYIIDAHNNNKHYRYVNKIVAIVSLIMISGFITRISTLMYFDNKTPFFYNETRFSFNETSFFFNGTL